MRVTFLMKCTVCGEENYLTEKNKKNTPDRIEQMKFCPKCRKQTLHKEKTKKQLIISNDKKMPKKGIFLFLLNFNCNIIYKNI